MENIENSDTFFQQGFGIGPFQMMNEIGKGQFGKVYIGIHEETKEKVAIKQIQKSNENVNINLIKAEINIHKKLFHPYICKMYCVIENPDYIFIVTEYCGGGEILKTMEEQDAPFEEKMACKIFTQVLSAVEYLHNNYICHRDIKLENMLFDEYGDAKLTDFGLSKSFEGDILFEKAIGSPMYSAPEVFSSKPFKGKNADLWSMGVCLYVMVCGAFPFPGEELDDFLNNLLYKSFEVPDSVSSEFKDLIYQILEKDPSKRLTIEQIKSHKWLHMFDFNFMKSPGIVINKDILPIDINIIKEMVGYEETKIRNLINDILINMHNNNTISYYLRIESLKRKKGLSVSDIRPSSELFIKYIFDEKSKMKTYNNDINKKINELVEYIINEHKMEELKIRENIRNSLDIEKSKSDVVKNNNNVNIINNNNINEKNKNENKKYANNKIKMNHKHNILLSKTYRNIEDFQKMLKKVDEEKTEKEKKKKKKKKSKFEILNKYIGPLLFVHHLIDEIITKVVISKNTKEIKKRIIPVNNSSLNVLSTKPKKILEPVTIESNYNITINPLEKQKTDIKFNNYSIYTIEEIVYPATNTNTTGDKTFSFGFYKTNNKNEKNNKKSSKNLKFNTIFESANDVMKNSKKINNTIAVDDNNRRGKIINNIKNKNNKDNDKKKKLGHLHKNKSDLSCVMKSTQFSKVIKGFKEKIEKNGILKKNKKIKRSLSKKKTEKKINIFYDEINQYLKEKEKKRNKSEQIINKKKAAFSIFKNDKIENKDNKEKTSDIKYIYTNSEKNQKLLLSNRINRKTKKVNVNLNENINENLNINEISEKRANEKKGNNTTRTKKEEEKVEKKRNLNSSQTNFYNNKSTISIHYHTRKRTNTITLENSSRKNINQGRKIVIIRNKNKNKNNEKAIEERKKRPNSPVKMAESARKKGDDFKNNLFSSKKNLKISCQTGRNQKKQNIDKNYSCFDSPIKKQNDINDKNIKNKSSKSNSIHIKNNLAKKLEAKNDTNNEDNKNEVKQYEIISKKNENLVKTIIVDCIGNNNTTISNIAKGHIRFSCKLFVRKKKIVFNLNMIQKEKNKFAITGEFIDGDIKSFEKLFEQIKEKLE